MKILPGRKKIKLTTNDLFYIKPGDMGDVTETRNTVVFIVSLINHELNSGLKQRYYVYGTIKGSISNL